MPLEIAQPLPDRLTRDSPEHPLTLCGEKKRRSVASHLGQSFDPPRSTSSRSSNDSWENLDSARSQSSESWTNLDSPRSLSSEYELVEPPPRRRIRKLVNRKVPKEDNSLASIKEVTEDP